MLTVHSLGGGAAANGFLISLSFCEDPQHPCFCFLRLVSLLSRLVSHLFLSVFYQDVDDDEWHYAYDAFNGATACAAGYGRLDGAEQALSQASLVVRR